MKITDVLSSPERWTKGENARSADGKPAPIFGETAACFCLAGAGRKASRGDWHEVRQILMRAADELYPGHAFISSFNDNPDTTFEMVYRVAQRADELIEEKIK